MNNIIKITEEELTDLLVGRKLSLPKYVSPLLNLANRFAKGTVPAVVGQMTELVKPFKTYEEWKEWYLKEKPDAINNAVKKISNMLGNFKEAMNKIDEKTIRAWVEDLVLVKTFVGIRFQEAILKRVAHMLGKKYRLATPEEEAKGIDGFIEDVSISIKPYTYKIEAKRLQEKIKGCIIYYEKIEDGIKIDISELLSKFG
ncbi:MAG: restriction endonuclease [Candidatus Hadarchaeum yellowstonense]|uniref:Restriction endonuclease n=1 Tax=Hadarchaeum yellowstonense TaxID=1776334 RepID=A0A147JV57_HADYE|nr:MAG: restriction endonuclease [Candidatus Hadarchaeum yellowstonense]